VSDKTDTVVFIFGSIKTEPHAPKPEICPEVASRENFCCRLLRRNERNNWEF